MLVSLTPSRLLKLPYSGDATRGRSRKHWMSSSPRITRGLNTLQPPVLGKVPMLQVGGLVALSQRTA